MIGRDQDAPPAGITQPLDDRQVTIKDGRAALRFQLIVVTQGVDSIVVDHQAATSGRR